MYRKYVIVIFFFTCAVVVLPWGWGCISATLWGQFGTSLYDFAESNVLYLGTRILVEKNTLVSTGSIYLLK